MSRELKIKLQEELEGASWLAVQDNTGAVGKSWNKLKTQCFSAKALLNAKNTFVPQ